MRGSRTFTHFTALLETWLWGQTGRSPSPDVAVSSSTSPALLSPDYPDIPVEDEVRTPDAVASTLLRTAKVYLAGDPSETNLAHKLGTEATNPSFETSLAQLNVRFETLVELVEGTNSPIVVVSYVISSKPQALLETAVYNLFS